MKDPVQILNDETSLSLRLQSALGYSMPPVIPLKTKVTVKDAKDIEANPELQARLKSGLQALSELSFITPMSFWLTGIEAEEQAFKLPIDPILSLSCKNIITRRYVKKSDKGGTIKEHWSTDDWQLDISGVLATDDKHDVWYYTKELRRICEGGKRGIDVLCPVLHDVYDITRIVIEDYNFPFTKGEEYQAFTIKAYSDSTYTLLTEEKVL